MVPGSGNAVVGEQDVLSGWLGLVGNSELGTVLASASVLHFHRVSAIIDAACAAASHRLRVSSPSCRVVSREPQGSGRSSTTEWNTFTRRSVQTKFNSPTKRLVIRDYSLYSVAGLRNCA